MAEEKEFEYEGVTYEDMVKDLHKRKAEILDQFAKAYLAETQLMPSEIELVEKRDHEGNQIITTYTFRRKSESGEQGE